MKRVLFCLKYRENSWVKNDETYSSYGNLHSGLFNSARFMCDMLNESGIESKLVHCIDNNFIHREVVAYKPTHVIIEAYWVTPEKFVELKRVLPDITWIIRNHSEIPFLSGEGIAIDWTLKYLEFSNVIVACNSPRATEQIKLLSQEKFGNSDHVIYLPNFYPIESAKEPMRNLFKGPVLNIGCFGAIRPLKNQLTQAIAAIEFAKYLDKPMNFYINGSRIEMGGSPILKNLQQLFSHYKGYYNLIECPWDSDYHKLISTLDIGLQVSLSETFSIVSADFVNEGIPIITSKEIVWSTKALQADPTSHRDIFEKMKRAYWINRRIPFYNKSKKGLQKYNKESKKIWISYFS